MTYRKTLTMLAALSVTAGGLGVAAPPAVAKSRTLYVTAPLDQVTRRISYADLNLATAHDEAVLNGRVDGAVDDVCLEATGGRDGSLQTSVAMKGCEFGAWDGARPQIARAVQRARDIAATGTSTIAATAITIAVPRW